MMSMSRDDCRGSRVGCFREHAGDTPAATELLRREGSDDFFEARIAAQRVPIRHQFQFAIGGAAWISDGDGKLFAGEIFFTNPRSNHRQNFDHVQTIDCLLFHGKKLDRAPAFAQGLLLPPESGIDYTEHAPCRAVIRLILYDFFLFRVRSSKSQLRLMLVVCHSGDNAFHERTRETNGVDT